MKSTKDFETLWFRYKTEAEPKNISINQFCIQNGVEYTQFNKWFRNTRKDIVPVVIEDMPEELNPEKTESAHSGAATPEHVKGEIMVIIRTRSGLNIQQKNLDYQGLKELIQKLEGLC